MLHVHSFTFSPVQENTYVVYNEGGLCCIIDPGCYFASEELALKNFIEAHNLQPSAIWTIFSATVMCTAPGG